MLLNIILAVFLFTCCIPIENGWKGVKPLKTSKAEVDKILGKSGEDASGFHRYMVPEAEIVVDYSKEPCSLAPQGRGGYTVPVNTVLSYTVLLKAKPKVSDFEFNPKNSHRVSSEHLLNYASYVNDDDTVEINVMTEAGSEEFVYEIVYRGKNSDLERLRCKETSSASIANGWKGIKPLKTSKKEVEQLLGSSRVDNNGYFWYSTGDTDIEVNYSTEPCSENGTAVES